MTADNRNTGPKASAAESIVAAPVRAYDQQGSRIREQNLIIEKPVTLDLNGREIVTLLCSGHHLQELAAGFFFAEGFLETIQDLKDISVDAESGRVSVTTLKPATLTEKLWEKRTVSSGCGKGTVFFNAMDALLSKPVESDITIDPLTPPAIMKHLHTLSAKYRQTHGVHNSALATQEKIIIFRDDIGRHNAVDMIVGHAFLNGIKLQDKLLVTTGRLTSEIIIKVAKIGIPVIISRNTATSLAVEIARSLRITLIGFVRAGKFLVYCGNERLVPAGRAPVEPQQ